MATFFALIFLTKMYKRKGRGLSQKNLLYTMQIPSLYTQPPPSLMFGKWWLHCLCPYLSADRFFVQRYSLSSYGQQSNLAAQAISQQKMAKLVQNAFGSEFQTKCPEFQLMVTYDPVNNKMIFDGTILRYCDHKHFKEVVEDVIKSTGWIHNLKELVLDYLVTDQLRGVLSISPSGPSGITKEERIGDDTAICIFRDKKAYKDKINRSQEIFMIADGDVILEEVLKYFRERDVEGSSCFFQRAKAGQIPQTDTDWNRKWQLIDSTTFTDRINTAWFRQNETNY